MSAARPETLVHRIAVVTACAALLPIVVGALVTTLGAGMAFLDWPSSDGHNMLLYPWLRDVAQGNTDKAVEHAHRLAGMLIGLISIALAAVAWWREPRLWVRWAATAVLLAVIVQGILGGVRVLQDERLYAMLHGSFAALVFALMGGVALVTGRAWRSADGRLSRADGASAPDPALGGSAAAVSRLSPARLRVLAFATALVVFVQFLLGGLLRHLGRALFEHLAVAGLALLLVVAMAVVSHRSGSAWLRRSAWILLAILLVQGVLGAGAWVNKYGFPPAGYVAVQHSLPQIAFRTAHTVVGMLVFLAAVLHALRVWRLTGAERSAGRPSPRAVNDGPAAPLSPDGLGLRSAGTIPKGGLA